jgi:hypothetical protein
MSEIIAIPSQPVVQLPDGSQILAVELANLLAPAAYGTHYRQSFSCTQAHTSGLVVCAVTLRAC